MTRLTPAVFALLGSTFAATAALAAAQADDSPPAPSVAPACVRARPASGEAPNAARGRRLFGLAATALQMAGPMAQSVGGGSRMGALAGAVVQTGATAALQNAALRARSEATDSADAACLPVTP